MEKIINLQRSYFNQGKTLPVEVRRNALKALKACIKKHEADIMSALKSDLGKSETESYISEIGMLYEDINYTLKHLSSWARPKRVSTPSSIAPASSFIQQCPYGVVLIIAPWNYPLLLSLSPLVGALAAGNCCVVKPSELAPASAAVITTIIEETFGPQLVATINGGVEESKALLEQQFDYIFYTGNTSVGRYVMQKAADHLTPVTLELGGKSPVIISRSANIRLAARRIAFGKCMNLGQTCVAPDYVLIEEQVHDEFIRLIKEEITKMYGTNPLDNQSYGKIINRRHYDRICKLIDADKVVFGGERDEQGVRISPTIMDNVSALDAVMQEEIFGPVLPVIKIRNIDEAMQFVQQRPHPLALYLFSNDGREQKRVMQGLQYGGGCINDVVIHLSNLNLPFGGIGESGMGSYHGVASFQTFSHAQSVVKASSWIDMPVRYQPYTKMKDRLLHLFLGK